MLLLLLLAAVPLLLGHQLDVIGGQQRAFAYALVCVCVCFGVAKTRGARAGRKWSSRLIFAGLKTARRLTD